MIKTSLFKQSSSKQVGKLVLDLNALRDSLLINSGQFKESGQSKDFIFELSIRSSRMFLYLLRIAIILDFLFTPLTACLSTCFEKIITIWFWRGRGVLAQVFPK